MDTGQSARSMGFGMAVWVLTGHILFPATIPPADPALTGAAFIYLINDGVTLLRPAGSFLLSLLSKGKLPTTDAEVKS
jgi:hypothetical protein